MWLSIGVTVLGVLGVILNVSLAWPQVWRATHSVEGIALGTVLAGFFGRALWSVYAVHVADLALLVGQAPVALGFATIAFFVGWARPETRLPLGGGLLASLVVAVALVIAPPILVGLAIVVAAVVNVPQMTRVLRDPATAGGVSSAMYWLTAGASATWLSYGIVAGDLAISAPHVILLPTGILTAVAVRRVSRRTSSGHFRRGRTVARTAPARRRLRR